ncbi:hypothetical protein B4589_009870 [Halolamina sp. CBA1230]|uniref:hypothetical protein n=1 Tax=Halolamina sp. CBA1230 TaxID=1853690 RepID=UPI0009A1426D|nr:hypothetical protein [Halolamina sp. CBA1230]QKY20671.1 hypothetical protein B4589_009870 [Halolamina sp. CBA1230]
MTEYDGLDIKNLRERLAKNGDIHALQEAGLLDERTIKKLLSYKRSYESESAAHYDNPEETAYYARNTKYWRETVERELSENLRKAVQNGNWQVIAFALGRGSSEEQVRMDFGDYEKHRSLLQEPGLVELMFAGMGGGKTMTAVRQAETWMMIYPNGMVVSNIKSWSEKHDRVEYVGDLRDLVETASENPEQRVFAVLDEFGLKGSAYGGINQEAMEKVMKNFVRLMRKEPYKLQIVGISQRPTDIHPTLRNDKLAVYAIKEGASKADKQKHMVIYDETTDDKCTQPDEDAVRCDLRGIGMPTTPPDTDDKADWDWGTPEDWVELGLTTWEELDMDEEEASGGSQPVQCAYLKDGEEQCGALVYDGHESGMCQAHRHRDDREERRVEA